MNIKYKVKKLPSKETLHFYLNEYLMNLLKKKLPRGISRTICEQKPVNLKY